MYFGFFGRGKLKRSFIIIIFIIIFPLIYAQSIVGEVGSERLSETDDSAQLVEPQTDDRINESDITFSFDDAQEASATEPLRVFGFGNLVRMVFVLALVVGMIYALYYFLRRGKKLIETENSFISVLDSKTLPNGRILYIIDIASHVYLLGSGDGGLSLITEIEDKLTIDSLRMQVDRQQSNPHSFSELMSSFFTKRTTMKQDAKLPEVGFDYLHQQRQKLKKETI